MRAFILLASLSLAPAAHAGVDFKCESVRFADQVSGWLRFGSGGRNGSIQLEYWNGYPPITLVEASLDNGKVLAGGAIRFASAADAYNGTVAFVDVDAGYLEADHFKAKAELLSSRDGRTTERKYDLNCVRH